MKKRRALLFISLILLLLIAIPTGFLVREFRQEKASRDLIAAMKANATRSNTSSTTGIDQSKAIAIAKQAIVDNEKGSGDQWVYEATLQEKGWAVLANRIEGYGWDGKPQFVVGGDRLILIDRNGKVSSYIHGL